nr:hypothetical protein CFP56_30214 [Quercus suber]
MAGLAGISSATLSQIPGMPAPLGKTPNFDDPAVDGSTRPEVIAVGAIPAGLTVLCCAMRVYTRVWVSKSAGWDDGKVFPKATNDYFAENLVQCCHSGRCSHVEHLSGNSDKISSPAACDRLYLLRTNFIDRQNSACFFLPPPFFDQAASPSCHLGNHRLVRIRVVLRAFLVYWQMRTGWPCICLLLREDNSTVPCCSSSQHRHGYHATRDSSLGYLSTADAPPQEDRCKFDLSDRLVVSLQLPFARRHAADRQHSAVLASCLGLYYRIVQKNSLDVTWNFAAVNILSMFEIDTTIIVACLPSFPALSDGKLTPLLTLIESTADLGRQALLAAKVDSIFSRRSRSRNSSRKDSKISPDLSESSKITVFSEIHQMEEGRGEIIQIQDHIAPFTSPSMPTYSKQELGQTGL